MKTNERAVRSGRAQPPSSPWRRFAVVIALAHGTACHEPRPESTHSAPAAPAVSATLPDAIPGFASGPIERGRAYERRAYTRGAARVTVTLATFAMNETAYAEWVRQSESGYPQAALDVPPGSGNGFYQCGDDDAGAGCALLVQLRAGAHLEIRGEGAATRADVDAVARGLPMRTLAEGRVGR